MVAVKHGLLDPEKGASHAHRMISEVGRKMQPAHRLDLGDFIEKGETDKRMNWMRRLAEAKVPEGVKAATKTIGSHGKVLATKAIDAMLEM